MTLAPGTARLRELVADGRTTLADVLDTIAKARARRPAKPAPRAPLPRVVPLTDKDRLSLRTLAGKIDQLELPADARELTEQERAEWIPLFAEIKAARKTITNAEIALRETFHNHLDVELGEDPPATVLQDEDGHYVAEGVVGAPGEALEVVRGLVGGKAAPLTLADLDKLEADGEITHNDYLRMTFAVRQVDAVKVMDELRRDRDGRLFKALGKVARLTPQTTAITVRKAKP